MFLVYGKNISRVTEDITFAYTHLNKKYINESALNGDKTLKSAAILY